MADCVEVFTVTPTIPEGKKDDVIPILSTLWWHFDLIVQQSVYCFFVMAVHGMREFSDWLPSLTD